MNKNIIRKLKAFCKERIMKYRDLRNKTSDKSLEVYHEGQLDAYVEVYNQYIVDLRD